MIFTDKELYNNPYYFYIKETTNGYDLYFSVAETISEARKKDKKISVPKEKIGKVKNYIKNIKKTSKTQDELSSEIEELVNIDGALMNSKVPIIDPTLHPRRTMDQTVAATRQTNNPLLRRGGYRSFYGESKVSEVDMSGAFGYEETKDMDGKETYNYYIKELGLEPDDAENRTRQQGKDPFGKKDEKSEYEDDKNFITRATLSEIQKQKMIKVLEDALVNKKDSSSSDVSKKETIKSIDDLPSLVGRNLKVLINQANKHGISKKELIKLLNGE
jgi:hypothetical protein